VLWYVVRHAEALQQSDRGLDGGWSALCRCSGLTGRGPANRQVKLGVSVSFLAQCQQGLRILFFGVEPFFGTPRMPTRVIPKFGSEGLPNRVLGKIRFLVFGRIQGPKCKHVTTSWNVEIDTSL
jgi:hypothetical protein